VPVVVGGREPHVRWVPEAELPPRAGDAGDAALRRYLDSGECQRLLHGAAPGRPRASVGGRSGGRAPSSSPAKTERARKQPRTDPPAVAKLQEALLKVMPRIDGYRPGDPARTAQPAGAAPRARPRPRPSKPGPLKRKCPRCGARPGVYCDTPSGFHPERKPASAQGKAKKKTKTKSRSVWTVSGGGFETNRRKH
jgi:hypothetical protein